MAKPTTNWTEANVINVRPPADKAGSSDVKVKHPTLPSLAIRFRNGVVPGTYTYYFSIGGKWQTFKIGKVGAVTLKFAEDEAKRHAANLSGVAPVNPVVERAKAVAELASPMRELIDLFLQSQRDKGRSADYVGRQETQLVDYFAGLHTIPIKLVDKSTVVRELDKIKTARGKISMTRARATLSKFFNWAQSRDYCEHNPVSHTEKFESVPRDRVLQPRELAIIWQATLQHSDAQYGRIVRLLMLTGARRTQIGGLRGHELNEDDALVTLGGQLGIREAKRLAKLGEVEDESLSKNRQTFLIPLSRQALATFAAQTTRNGRYVFGNGKGEGGYSGWSDSMDELKAIIGDRVKADWGFHDFRRSFETLGQDLVKIADNVTDCCINHIPQAKTGTRRHYNFAMLLDERIDAMQRWADFIDTTVAKYGPKPKLVHSAAA